MNSLVVLISVMALAAAKPSGLQAGIVSYAAPAIAVAPAAVSHQSRVDIKSSPGVVATEVVAPLSRSVITDQAIVAAPAAYAAPTVYTAPLITAPAAVSSQSRVDIKSSPAIVSTVAVAPAAYSAISAPVVYSAPLANPVAYGATFTAPLAYTAPLAGFASYISPVVPEVSAADQPAAENAELPVAPTETPEVAAARAAHLEAKALEESHKIQKRSVGIVATGPVVSTYTTSPVFFNPSTAHVRQVSVSVPVYSAAYGLHPY